MTKAACVQLGEHGDGHREMHRSPGCSLPRRIDSALTPSEVHASVRLGQLAAAFVRPTRLRTGRPGYQLTGGR
jgi:hypothetical protein